MIKKLLIVSIFLTNLFSTQEYLAYNAYEEQNKEKIKKFKEAVLEDPISYFYKNKKPIKIALVYPADQLSDYWIRSKKSFEARLNELKINYTLKEYYTKKLDIQQQYKGLQQALKNNSDYIVFTMAVDKHKTLIKSIINKKDTKLILQNITTPLKEFGKKQPFFYVGFDHQKGSEILAQEFINQVGKDGKYAVLFYSDGYVSKKRGDSFINYMKKHSNLKLAQSYITQGNKERAKLATLDLLKREKDIKFIYSCATDITLGAIEALKETKMLGKIKINGWGGGSVELDSILKEEIDLTVMRQNDDNGIAMAEAIKLDLTNNTKQVPLAFSGEFKLIKKGVSKEKLQELKKHAFRYSGQIK